MMVHDMEMPSSITYKPPPPQPIQESSSKLPSPPPISSLPDIRKNETAHGNRVISATQTPDYHHLHQNQHQHQLSLHQQAAANRTVGESVPDPDPDPAAMPTAVVASASNPKTPPPQSQLQRQAQPVSSDANSFTVISYQECLKNHAVSIGGHVLDGCGEFMPSGEEGILEALKCAACGCHRNFHRKEVDGEAQYTPNYYYNPMSNRSRRFTIHSTAPPPSFSAPPTHQHYKYPHGYTHGQPLGQTQMTAIGGSSRAPAESLGEDLNMFQSNSGVQAMGHPSFSTSKKRFRTKFTQAQKDRMHDFAEKLGWRIQRQDEQEVQRFCNQVNVKRKVFKVWMHNNKQALRKKTP